MRAAVFQLSQGSFQLLQSKVLLRLSCAAHVGMKPGYIISSTGSFMMRLKELITCRAITYGKKDNRPWSLPWGPLESREHGGRRKPGPHVWLCSWLESGHAQASHHLGLSFPRGKKNLDFSNWESRGALLLNQMSAEVKGQAPTKTTKGLDITARDTEFHLQTQCSQQTLMLRSPACRAWPRILSQSEAGLSLQRCFSVGSEH